MNKITPHQSHANDDGCRTMVGGAAGPQAPVDVVGLVRPVGRAVALVPLTETGAAARLAAAVVVRDDIVTTIGRIAAGADPGDG